MGIFKSILTMLAPGEEECQPVNLGRNDDCWCGSGRKYKKCHLEEDAKKLRSKFAVKCGST